MWSFYLNYGATGVVKNLGRDGFQFKLSKGSLLTWQTIKKEDGYLEGHFLPAKERQSMSWHGEEIDKISYYSPDSKEPYLTYSCQRTTPDTVDVIREWAGKKVEYQVVVISRNEEGQITHYRCLLPEGTWEAILTYDTQGHLVREDISTLSEKGTFEYTYDDHGVLIVQSSTIK